MLLDAEHQSKFAGKFMDLYFNKQPSDATTLLMLLFYALFLNLKSKD